MRRIVFALLALLLVCSSALADAVRPVTLRVKEQEPGLFLVQWKVPTQLPTGAAPSPVLPESCNAVGERSRIERGGTWLMEQTYRCPTGLSGEVIGIEFPIVNVTMSTIVRVELLSGERYAHVLQPGETTWRVPDSITDSVPAWMRSAREAVLSGVTHVVRHPIDVVFPLALLLLMLGGAPGASLGAALRLATAFSAAQLVAVLFSSVTGAALSPGYAELGIPIAAAVLAREALRPPGERTQLVAVSAVAGLVHGFGMSSALGGSIAVFGSTTLAGCLAVLGFDATLIVSVVLLEWIGRLILRRTASLPDPSRACPAPLAYVVGGAALGLALVAPFAWTQDAAASAPPSMQLADLAVPDSGSAAASRRLAARIPDATLQSFLSVEAFETRHETLVRLGDLAERFELDVAGTLAVDEQAAIKERVLGLVKSRTSVTVNESAVEPIDWRVDFLTLDINGALPRPSPVPEPVATAWVGVTAVYATETTPTAASVTWSGFDLTPQIPATVTDPESSRSVDLSAESPTLSWVNELEEDPAPVVKATAVEAQTVWVPLLALLAAGLLAWRALRGRAQDPSLARIRTGLTVVALLLPIGGVAWALPAAAGATPAPTRARQILTGVLPNLYRSFEFPTESVAYDRLSLTVSGPILRDVYLEHRRAVQMEERGGARVRIEAVEVVDVESTKPAGPDAPGGFTAQALWTVGGTVTHFGHRHFRQNRYDARVTLMPVDGSWKIQAIEVLDEKRLR